jgi:hypothetical protein
MDLARPEGEEIGGIADRLRRDLEPWQQLRDEPRVMRT